MQCFGYDNEQVTPIQQSLNDSMRQEAEMKVQSVNVLVEKMHFLAILRHLTNLYVETFQRVATGSCHYEYMKHPSG